MEERVLIVGAGFLGQALADHLARAGLTVTASSRMSVLGWHKWVPLDAMDLDSCAKVVAEVRPTIVLLAHGPSIVDWCELHPDEAIAVHENVARNMVLVAPGAWQVLISSDNVFPGNKAFFVESDHPCAPNAYGRAKLAAETVISSSTRSLVWRVSLVYGWRQEGQRDNFFNSVVTRLSARQPVHAPFDQWTTPIWVTDMVAVAAKLIAWKPTGVLHLGGPERLSRYHWAQRIAKVFDLDASLVAPVSKSDTSYACRPTNACLKSERYLGITSLPEVLAPTEAAIKLKRQ